MQTPYDADYFLNGVATGKSNYVNYSWQEGPTMALANRVVEVMQIQPGEHFMDFGCARGYLVKALRRIGVPAWGHDISRWAVENCDPDVKSFVSCNPDLEGGSFEHIFCKDVAEHMEPMELTNVLDWMMKAAQKSILIIVPLLGWQGYVREEDNFDKTHKICWSLEAWMGFIWDRVLCGGGDWELQGSWHIPGLKPTSLSHPKSCGFITLRRI